MYDLFLHGFCFPFGIGFHVFPGLIRLEFSRWYFYGLLTKKGLRATLHGAPILALFFDAAPQGVFWELLWLLVVPALPPIGSNCAASDTLLATCLHPFDINFHGIDL